MNPSGQRMLASHVDWCLSVVCFTSTYVFLSRANGVLCWWPCFLPIRAVWGEDTFTLSFRFTRSSSSRLFLKLETPHGSPYDTRVSSVYCSCCIGIGHGLSSIRVHNDNLQCQSGSSAPLPPTSLGSFSVPLKCVLPVPKVHIFIGAFCPFARPWAPGWAFWSCTLFHLFGKRMSKAE